MASTLEAIRKVVWPKEPRTDVWAVVDGAQDRRIYPNLINSYANYACLYRGELHPQLEAAAPYLVQLDFEEEFTRYLFNQGWGNGWFILLKSGGGLDRVQRHLRTLLRVEDHSGRKLVFRYYDPRVLRVYLPTCFSDELKTVYGSIESFWTEGEEPSVILDFRVEQGKLVQKPIDLTA